MLVDSTLSGQQQWEAKPTTHDEHLLVRHHGSGGSLDFMATEHVHDIKRTCDLGTLKQYIAILEEAFGKGELEIAIENVGCCGTRHTITDEGHELDQIQYISKIRPINNTALTFGKDDDPADATNAKLYLSLVMAMAFVLMTRWDVHFHLTALQRWLQKPHHRHIRKINDIVRWVQRHPRKLLY